MTCCIFCRQQDDPSGMKVYSTCDISNGKPCASCAEYLTLEAEIKKMRQSLETKLARQREIQEDINRQHDVLGGRMPLEIAAYIFELAASVVAVDNQSANSAPLLEGEKYAPLFLGAVCRAWRDVAWRMPKLWTFIYIHIPTVENLPVRFDIVKQWLSRSGEKLPLSIHLLTHETYNPDDVYTDAESDRLGDEFLENFEPLAEFLAIHSRRWQVLCATCPPKVLELLSGFSEGTPILRTLQLSSTRSPDLAFLPFEFGAHAVPQPSSLLLNKVSPGWGISIDWSRITSFTIESVSFDDVVAILPPMQNNLVKLMLRNMRGFHGNSAPSITLSKLRSLDLKVSARESYIFLSALTLPSLKQFSIDLKGEKSVVIRVVSLIQRSSCSLVSMSLGSVPDAGPPLSDLLGCINSVEDLEIRTPQQSFVRECYFHRALINSGRHPNNRSQLSPLSKLQRLRYTLDPHDDFTPDILINGIIDPSWKQRFSQWKTLSISFEPNPAFFNDPNNTGYMIEMFPRQTRQRLLELVDSGIELFLPLKIDRKDILRTMQDRPTSTMNDFIVLHAVLSAMPN